MRFNQFAGTLAATAAVSLGAMTGMAHAQQVPFASLNSVNGTSPFSFTAGTGFNTVVTAMSASFASQQTLPLAAQNLPVALTFTTGAALSPASISGTNTVDQIFGPGSFSISSSATPAVVLLSGTFGNSVLSGSLGANTATLSMVAGQTAIFTGGTYFVNSGLANPGALSFAFTSVNPLLSVTGGNINSFTASGAGTFTATRGTQVPEPSAYVAMATAGSSLMGLMVRARRRRSPLVAA